MDGLKKAFNEQQRATTSNYEQLRATTSNYMQLLTHFTLSHSLVVCDHTKNVKQIVPEDNNVIPPLEVTDNAGGI